MDVERALWDLQSADWRTAVQAAERLAGAPGDIVTCALADALDAYDTAITDAAARSLITRNEPDTADLLWMALTTLEDDVTDQIWDVVLHDSKHPVSQELQRRRQETVSRPSTKVAYAALDLDATAEAALAKFISGYADLVVEVLDEAKLEEPICSVCLSPGQDQELDSLTVIYAGRSSDRERMIRDGLHGWEGAWDPYAFRDEDDTVHPTYDEHVAAHYVPLQPALLEAWRRVRDAVEDRCLDPIYWVHGRIAYDLNRRTLPIPATDDLAVWVFNHGAGQGDLLEMLDAVLRPETNAALRDSGLIGEDEEAGYA